MQRSVDQHHGRVNHTLFHLNRWNDFGIYYRSFRYENIKFWKIEFSQRLYINALMLFHCKWYILDMASTTSLACCRAMNAKCNSCAQGKTIDEYCRENEKVEGCFGILIIRTTSLKICLAIIQQILMFLLQVLFILNSRDWQDPKKALKRLSK